MNLKMMFYPIIENITILNISLFLLFNGNIIIRLKNIKKIV